MELINGKRCLQPEHIIKFKDNLPNETVVTVYIEKDDFYLDFKLEELIEIFKNEEVRNHVSDNNTVINFIAEEKVLELLGADYNYWSTSTRKLNKLFSLNNVSSTKKESKVVSADLHKVAIGIYDKDLNAVVDIVILEGTLKQLPNLMNKQYAKNQVKTFFANNTLFCVGYKDDSELEELSNWKTLEKLVEEGVLVV